METTTPLNFPPNNCTLTHYPAAPPDPLFTSLFTLLKRNMYTLYKNSTMGWSKKDKIDEMRLPGLQYLVLEDSSDDHKVNGPNLAAFASFMVDLEDDIPVVYLYEIQVSPLHRNRGIGERLMREVERRAAELRLAAEKECGREKERVEKVMLTVFSANKGARRFYERLG
ncbi:hypothetical protein EX30DRAFT_153577 [Ascodesmis nigricans]|uniref:N-alpha-acetyltransferase 40 n=1 Tax=Ascodesmis nigricans TaxID=341454 RepID=A0A4S2N316_9PEZI|nr:hypothetical protein EX30DRAFT_153577 [Ascodesmis nigricans]